MGNKDKKLPHTFDHHPVRTAIFQLNRS